jgi:ribonuclease P protein component
MLVLRATWCDSDRIRFGLVTSKRLGKAVRRNRARRLVREAIWRLCSRIRPGTDLVLVARSGILDATAQQVLGELENLASRAGLFEGPPEDRPSTGGSTF